MRPRTFAVITGLAMLVFGMAPSSLAGDDGREGAQPGTPVSAAAESIEDGNGADIDGGLADVVHNDDVIVDGSLCVGFDCFNGYSFGFDTIVLRENNLRIVFDASPIGQRHEDATQVANGDAFDHQPTKDVGQREERDGLRYALGDQVGEGGLDLLQHGPGLAEADEIGRPAA